MHIPHSKPFLDNAEREAVSTVLASGHLSEGKAVQALEHTLAHMVGHRYGVAVSSGTAALFLALKALGIKKGMGVIIPSYTCTALLNAVLFSGAKPILCDVDPVSGTMSVQHIKKKIKGTARMIIVPHLFGNPADIAAIRSLGIPVIEDCAQCVGAVVHGRPVGGLSGASIFSFYTTKVLGAGEGGLIAVSDASIAARLRDLREYDNRDDYEPRFNFKLSDIHAAIALQQCRKLREIVALRRSIASAYRETLESFSSLCAPLAAIPGAKPMYYRFVIRIFDGSERFIRKMGEHGVVCAKPVYKPLHRYLGISGFNNSDTLHRQAVSIPCYPALTKTKIRYILKCIREILNFLR